MQIVGFDRRVGEEPGTLWLASDGSVEELDLVPGRDLSLGLGERHCAGLADGESHTECSNPAAPYCDLHTSRWPCARCTGTCDMPIENCYEEHAIYLAAFAPAIFKVGVTKTRRLPTRLEEQGAELAAHIRTVENGREARSIEYELARDLTDRVRVPQKIAGLHLEVDSEAWRDLLSDFEVLEEFTFDYDLALDRQPVQETLADGEVLGTKGRILVLGNGGTTYAVDLRDLVGHEVTETPTPIKRQSSLGAYE